MGSNPNVVYCGFQSGLAQFTVQVATSNPLSRPHLCCDIYLMSRQRLQVSAAFELVFHVVTTLLYAFAGLRCSLMMSRHHDLVATFALVPCSLQWLLLMSRHRDVVATSVQVSCSLQWLLLMSRHRDVVATSRCCRDIAMLSRHRDVVATSRCCRDIAMLSRHRDVVATSAQVSCSLPLVVVMSRPQ